MYAIADAFDGHHGYTPSCATPQQSPSESSSAQGWMANLLDAARSRGAAP